MKKRLAIFLAVCVAFALPFSANAEEFEPLSKQEGVQLSAQELQEAQIRMEGDNLITVTNISEESPIVAQVNGTETLVNSETDGLTDVQATDITTTAILVSDNEKTKEVYDGLIAAAYNNSSYKENGNYVAGLTIHSTVYYTTEIDDGEEFHRLIRVNGGNNKKNASQVIGNGFTIASQYVTYGVCGLNLEGMSTLGFSDRLNMSNTAGSFNINVDSLHSNWPTTADYQGLIGATYTVDIYNTRDNKHIYLELTNNIGSLSLGVW